MELSRYDFYTNLSGFSYLQIALVRLWWAHSLIHVCIRSWRKSGEEVAIVDTMIPKLKEWYFIINISDTKNVRLILYIFIYIMKSVTYVWPQFVPKSFIPLLWNSEQILSGELQINLTREQFKEINVFLQLDIVTSVVDRVSLNVHKFVRALCN